MPHTDRTHRTHLDPTALSALLPAALLALATQTSLYAVAVEGDSLSPRVTHGQLLAVVPAVDADPETIEPGALVLAAIAADPDQPHRFDRPAIYALNADRDISTSRGTVEHGRYLVLGIVQSTH